MNKKQKYEIVRKVNNFVYQEKKKVYLFIGFEFFVKMPISYQLYGIL